MNSTKRIHFTIEDLDHIEAALIHYASVVKDLSHVKHMLLMLTVQKAVNVRERKIASNLRQYKKAKV